MDAERRPGTRLIAWSLIGGVALLLGGSVAIAASPPSASFGWFAYQPLSQAVLLPAAAASPLGTAGVVAMVLGAAAIVFAAGLAVGRRLR